MLVGLETKHINCTSLLKVVQLVKIQCCLYGIAFHFVLINKSCLFVVHSKAAFSKVFIVFLIYANQQALVISIQQSYHV